MIKLNKRIILPGGAGLVGQNLVVRLLSKGFSDIVVIDKHPINLEKLKRMQPSITTILADLAEPGIWENSFDGADCVVLLQAQIGGNNYSDFVRNNIDSTQMIINAIRRYNIRNVIHISSSVVESLSEDYYTKTKKYQEKLISESGILCPILRPTLMFGWFDRKHLGWLARFMKKIPFFPIPANGKFLRQPLYVGDFCNVIISCIEGHIKSGTFNITGHEKIDYIDIIRAIKTSVKAKTIIIKIPYPLFYYMLWIWGMLDKNPPFTTQQLSALVANDEFELIDWPRIFNVPYTPFAEAIEETFCHPVYSKIFMEF